jgi:hypothetical protein
MRATHRQSWLSAVILLGAVYALVGIVFAWPTSHVHAWRLAAWAVSGAAYAIHIGYEHFRLRNSSFSAALHVALAVALGAFGLAVGAIVHSLSVTTTPQHQRLLLIALVAWPVIVGVPAFLVGLVASRLLARLSRRGRAE